jgi:hypothetical protein
MVSGQRSSPERRTGTFLGKIKKPSVRRRLLQKSSFFSSVQVLNENLLELAPFQSSVETLLVAEVSTGHFPRPLWIRKFTMKFTNHFDYLTNLQQVRVECNGFFSIKLFLCRGWGNRLDCWVRGEWIP